ncbi:MAG TPA: alpha-amylase family glycosyl hydrolase [Acidimicrobiia bacterium]|nr:alpha-amylase family glycosyl hydrolase [Acidimicrobiia bacterium]
MSHGRSATLAVVVALLAACSPPATAPSTTAVPTTAGSAPTTTAPAPSGLVAEPVRHPAQHHSIYFVMPDRFANGDPTNDTGGIEGDPLEHGFLPEDKGYFQGGDLIGLADRLDYLSELGMSALWLTPPFANRAVQGLGDIGNSSAGYHGYWQIDWSRIDPHLGTEEDMQRLLARARDLGVDVFFDVVVNHTGDVITYSEGSFAYRSKNAAPYLDAAGMPFDDAEFAGSEDFPELDPAVSFPYTPTFRSPEDAAIKSPDWLNNPIYYHNRGDSTFVDESAYYGDFFGLDDLFTEHPDVVDGLIDLYTDVIGRYDIAGFRIDTVKHVNDEFWTQWTPAVLTAAADAGRPDFFVFGEVFTTDPIFNSHYTTNLGLPSILDFIVNQGLEQYVARGLPADTLSQAFDQDDWFTDVDSNASMLVKFFGNHDMGRMGRLIAVANPGARPAVHIEKMLLGFDLLFLTRGIPVVYYGDEQGFVGIGGDRSARQTMFPATATEYVGQETIGSDATVSDDNFDPEHPFYRRIATLNALRRDHPGLVTGAQIVGPPQGPIFSFSRIDRDERIEYLVVANNGPIAVDGTVVALSRDTEFVAILGSEKVVRSDGDATVTISVPARSAVVLQAATALAIPDTAATVTLTRPNAGQEIPTPRYRIEASVSDSRYAEVTFSISVDGAAPIVLGVDDAPPYRIYWNNHDIPTGAEVEITATVTDGSGRTSATTLPVTLADRG